MARGHIRQRGNGGFQAVVYAGVDPVTKRQQYLYETAAAYKEAERALTRLLGQVDERRAPKTKATLGYVVDRWLEVADLELSTRETYLDYVERTIRPALGDVQVRKLTVDVLDRFYLHLRKHGGKCQRCWRRVRAGQPPLRAGERYQPRPGAKPVVHQPDCARGRPLAASTVRQVHAIVRQALGQAVKWGWLPSNPALLASPPSVPQRQVAPPSPEDLARLINAAWAADPDFGALLWLDMTTGARRGELCALRWPDVDLDGGVLRIARAYVVRGGQRLVKDTKTHQQRLVALDQATVEILLDHRQRCLARATEARVELAGHGYVFSLWPDGRDPLQPDSVTQRVGRLAKRLGISAHLHLLRHFSATELLAAGADLRTVAGRLGHGAGGATTLRVYAHPVTEADRRAASLIGQRLKRPDQAP
jgi:integrase